MLGWSWWPTPRPGRFTPHPRKEPQYPPCRRLGEPWGRNGLVRKISPHPPGFEPWTVKLVGSRYADWAIPAARTIYRCVATWRTAILVKVFSYSTRKLAVSQETCRFLANFITDCFWILLCVSSFQSNHSRQYITILPQYLHLYLSRYLLPSAKQQELVQSNTPFIV